jgi:dephospho-CoA kinase
MLTVGLTGSIAVGKTFVCQVLRELGCPVLDADQISREVVEKGSSGLAEVVRKFGSDILTAHGELDRKAMGKIVFADAAKRELLNSIIHPPVIEKQNEWIEQQDAPIAFIDAALMIESGGYKRFDKIVVVWCEADIQLQRLMARDGLDVEAAKMRIATQMPQEEKKQFANYLIDTSKGYEDTRRQVTELVSELRSMQSA